MMFVENLFSEKDFVLTTERGPIEYRLCMNVVEYSFPAYMDKEYAVEQLKREVL